MERIVSDKMTKTKSTHSDKHLLLQIRKSYAKKKKNPQVLPCTSRCSRVPSSTPLRPTGMCTPTVWVQNKAILEQLELRSSQHNYRNSHVLLCRTKTQKLNNMCKPAPSVAQQALLWESPHTARKQCLML